MPTALNGNRKPDSFPSLPRQAANLAGAIGRTIGAVARGKSIIVPPEVLKMREAICGVCEENLSGRCKKCGCGVRAHLVRKTQFAREECPLTPPKWGKYEAP